MWSFADKGWSFSRKSIFNQGNNALNMLESLQKIQMFVLQDIDKLDFTCYFEKLSAVVYFEECIKMAPPLKNLVGNQQNVNFWTHEFFLFRLEEIKLYLPKSQCKW